MEKEELLKKFIQTNINVKPHNTEKLYVISIVGLNGSGKSTLARALAKDLGLYIASNDAIRRFLNNEGYGGAHPRQDLLEYIAESSGEYLYGQSVSYIIDADILKFHAPARARAEKHGAKFYIFKAECPEGVILKRLRRRSDESTKSENDLSMADVDEYEKRKKIHQEMPQPEYDFVFRTQEPLEPQIDEVKTKLGL